jgi:outer membrane autotransporter protein
MSGLEGGPILGDTKDGKETAPPPAPAKPMYWGMFASGNAIFSQIDAHDGMTSDASFLTAGLLMGLDAKVTDDLTAGILFSYQHTDGEMDQQGSNAYVNNYTGGLYAGWHDDGFYLNGLTTFGGNVYTAERKILFNSIDRTAQSRTDGSQAAADIDGGYDFHLCKDLTISPLAGLQYVHLTVGGFNESGADAADLSIRQQDADSLRSRLGFRVDYHIPVGKDWAYATEFRAAWQHEYLDDSRAIISSFEDSGLSAFSVRTINPERDAALVGIGINATCKGRLTLFLDYDVQAGQADYLQQSVKGGIKWTF